MVVGYGTRVPSGSLPVFSVADEKEARALLTIACETNLRGEFIAKELVREQTVDNLFTFSDRLNKCHKFLVKRGACRCLDE